jgi:uncharacterized protein (TIGR03435 family)
MKLIQRMCLISVVISAVLCSSLFAQTPAPTKLAFEVATVKPAPPLMTLVQDMQSGKRGIGSLMNIDAARVDLGYVQLKGLLAMAYKLKTHQIVGPEWLDSQAFEIHAKFPEGATKEQLPEMMQTLLVERFKLVTHREDKEQSVYALIVSKDGHKMKEVVEDAPVPAPAAPVEGADKTPIQMKSSEDGKELSVNMPQGQMTMKTDGKGGTVISGGGIGQMKVNTDPTTGLSMEISKAKMSDLIELLSQFVDKPIVDMTGLKGSYEVKLQVPLEDLLSVVQKIAPKIGLSLPPGLGNSGAIAGAAPGGAGLTASDPTGGSGFFKAIEKLGLKLDSRKMPVDSLVVDHIEKTPTED